MIDCGHSGSGANVSIARITTAMSTICAMDAWRSRGMTIAPTIKLRARAARYPIPIVWKNGAIATTVMAPTHRALLMARSRRGISMSGRPVGSIAQVSRRNTLAGPPERGTAYSSRTNGGVLLVSTIKIVREAPIATVQLDRPEVLNALSEELMDELVSSLETLDNEADIRCIVLTGNEKAFAAGADIKESFVDATPASMLEQDLTTRWERVRRIRKPIIAAVSGYCLGGGCELAMTCDIIVASETAQFGQPEVNLGIIPGAGGTQRLTRAVGKYRAMDIILTGRRVKADEAKAIGLVAQVYPAASWLEDAKTLARTIAEKPPIAVRLATEAIDLAFNSTLDAGLEFERKAFYLLFSTEDKKEGVDAFVNKRKAVFKGK